MKKEYSFNKKIIKVNIDYGTINIYRDNICLPFIRYSESYEVEEGKNKVKVFENKNVSTYSHDNITINSSNCVVISSGSLTIVNGQVYNSNAEEFSNKTTDDNKEIEIILPKASQDYEFDVSISSGNLSLDDVILNRLDASISSGNIDMNDVDIMQTRLKIMSGSTHIKIAEASDNYDAEIKVFSGIVNNRSVSSVYNDSNNKSVKRLLKVSLMSGNLDLLFKGKK